jgi:hypothetical protein
MVLYEDNRVCRGCGRMGVTRHTCPFCSCNYCKKDGHIANNCTRAQESKESHRPVGSFADGNPASGGPLSNAFSTKPRKNQQRLPPRHNADITAGSAAVATSSADGVVPAQTHWANISHNAHQPLIPASRLRESPSPRTLRRGA